MKKSGLVLMFLLFSCTVFSQFSIYELHGTQTNPYASPYSLLTLDTLQDAQVIGDIYGKYRSDWVDSYIKVEVTTICNGVNQTATSPNDTLTQDQLTLLREAEANCSVNITIDYIPSNELTYNPARTMAFTLRPVPIVEAKFPGGNQHLQTYIEKYIVNKISPSILEQIQLASVQFSITTDGQTADAQIIHNSGNDEIDQLILAAICDMPYWQPAKNVEGLTVAQTFQFNMGTDLLRCDYRYKF